MPNHTVRRLVEGAMIAAIYLVLTFASRLLGIADGAVQFRLSEALTVLPVFTPAAIPGLTIGCLFANLGSPFGIADIISGTLATLCAALLTRWCRSITWRGIPWLAPVPPIVLNGVIVGLTVTLMNEVGHIVPSQFSFAAFGLTAFTVALGELAVCAGLGPPLFYALKKSGAANHLFHSAP